MASIGLDRHLYLLPFDHRLVLQKHLFGWTGTLEPEQTAKIAAAKQVIYDAFKAAIATGVPKERAGIIVDEQFGAGILRDAVAHGYWTACAIEKRGQQEFDFEYGIEYRQHIATFRPSCCKVRVCYNPEGNRALNRRQATRLRRLSDYLHSTDTSLFMFQLIVPPETSHLDCVKRDKTAYDMELRPRLMVQAIEELQRAGVEPDIWKIEGLDRRTDCERIVAAARRGGRKKVGCIVLGRSEDETKVRRWLTTAAGVRGFIGFAVGRTNFWDPLSSWRQGTITREEAVAAIARRYRRSVDIFEGKGKLSAAA
jgi:5-dehydro-2-deoxygluconokinase